MDLKQLLSQTTIQSNTTEGITGGEGITEGIDESIGEDNGEGITEGIDEDNGDDIDESIGEGDGSHDQRFLQHWNKLEKGNWSEISLTAFENSSIFYNYAGIFMCYGIKKVYNEVLKVYGK